MMRLTKLTRSRNWPQMLDLLLVLVVTLLGIALTIWFFSKTSDDEDDFEDPFDF